MIIFTSWLHPSNTFSFISLIENGLEKDTFCKEVQFLNEEFSIFVIDDGIVICLIFLFSLNQSDFISFKLFNSKFTSSSLILFDAKFKAVL